MPRPLAALVASGAIVVALAPSVARAGICQGDPDPVPMGQIVAGRESNFFCDNGWQWITKSPDETSQFACDFLVGHPQKFYLPENFVITSQGPPSANCKDRFEYDHNRMQIKLPTGETSACDPVGEYGSNIPDDFTIFRESGGGIGQACLSPPATAHIHPADPSGDYTCEIGTVPNGFVITGRANSNQCQHFSGSVREAIRKPGPGETINRVCYDPDEAPIPYGFGYVSPIASNQFCQGGPSYTLVPAQHGSGMCSAAGLPSHLVIGSITPSLYCGPGIYQYNVLDPLTDPDGTSNACYPESLPIPDSFVVTNHVENSTSCPPTNLAQTILKPDQEEGYLVCEHSPLPDGWVITGLSNALSGFCTQTGKQWSISYLDEGESAHVCDFSPIPAGFFFLSVGFGCPPLGGVSVGPNPVPGGRSCSTSLPLGYVITDIQPEDRCRNGGKSYAYAQLDDDGSVTNACEPSVVPDAFVITSRDLNNTTSCDGGIQIGVTLPQLEDSETICSGSGIPGGWVVTDSGPDDPANAPCEGDSYVRTIRDVEDAIGDGSSVNVCQGSPIPTEYVVTNELAGSGCVLENGTRWTIRLPSGTGTTSICAFSPIPQGFIQSGTGSGCNGHGTKLIVSVAPDPFILLEDDVTGPPAQVQIDCPEDVGTPGLLTGSASPNTAVCP